MAYAEPGVPKAQRRFAGSVSFFADVQELVVGLRILRRVDGVEQVLTDEHVVPGLATWDRHAVDRAVVDGRLPRERRDVRQVGVLEDRVAGQVLAQVGELALQQLREVLHDLHLHEVGQVAAGDRRRVLLGVVGVGHHGHGELHAHALVEALPPRVLVSTRWQRVVDVGHPGDLVRAAAWLLVHRLRPFLRVRLERRVDTLVGAGEVGLHAGVALVGRQDHLGVALRGVLAGVRFIAAASEGATAHQEGRAAGAG